MTAIVIKPNVAKVSITAPFVMDDVTLWSVTDDNLKADLRRETDRGWAGRSKKLS